MATSKARNIVLTGFMGTGKSTVGKLVAEALQLPFVDTDEAIVQRAGKPIAAIFADDGEAAFRLLERRVCRFYAGQPGYVIATGGGMLVDPTNLKVMQASGLVICLVASPETIRARLTGETGVRPLFAADWEALLQAREAAYAAVPHHIVTDERTPEQVVEEIIALWQKSL